MALAKDHCPGARALLSRAFADDAGLQAVAGEEPSLAWLEAWFEATLQVYLRHRQPAWVVCDGGEVIGVALVSSSRNPVSFLGRLGWSLEVGRNCGWDAVWRTARHEQRRARHRPGQPHAVLEFVAVDPARRNKGYSRLLLEQTHHWSRARGLAGVWLETTRPANLTFFERFGYQLLTRQPLPNRRDSFLMYRPNR